MSKQVSWQYHIEHFDAVGDAVYPSEELLNKFGADGWELVAVWDGAAYFKRPDDRNRPSWLNWCPRCEKYHCPKCVEGTCIVDD